jgi:hypothetical protein
MVIRPAQPRNCGLQAEPFGLSHENSALTFFEKFGKSTMIPIFVVYYLTNTLKLE